MQWKFWSKIIYLLGLIKVCLALPGVERSGGEGGAIYTLIYHGFGDSKKIILYG